MLSSETMAKRTRGSGRPGHRRPGTRPITRTGSFPISETSVGRTPARPPMSLTPDEEARAAELEANIRAEERAAETATRQARERARLADLGATRREGAAAAPLAVRAANE